VSRTVLATAWTELRSQWQVNTRLRIGAGLIGGILWIYALLVAGDAVVGTRMASEQLATEIDRMRPLTRANPWPARADDARQQLAALRSMEWVEGQAGDLGLVEAAFQDWVRGTAAQAGLRVREMSLSRAAAVPAEGGGQRPGSATPLRSGQAVKLRMTVEWGRVELVAFLAEVGRSERVVVVERLMLRPAATPPSAEIDLRIVARGAAVAPPAAGVAAGPER